MTALLTEKELEGAGFRRTPQARERRLPPGSGIVVGLAVGSVLWVIGLVIYFTFF